MEVRGREDKAPRQKFGEFRCRVEAKWRDSSVGAVTVLRPAVPRIISLFPACQALGPTTATAAGACSWPLALIKWKGQESAEMYLHTDTHTLGKTMKRCFCSCRWRRALEPHCRENRAPGIGPICCWWVRQSSLLSGRGSDCGVSVYSGQDRAEQRQYGLVAVPVREKEHWAAMWPQALHLLRFSDKECGSCMSVAGHSGHSFIVFSSSTATLLCLSPAFHCAGFCDLDWASWNGCVHASRGTFHVSH